MIDTVFIIKGISDGTIYIVFANEEDAENYIKKTDPNENYMTIEAYVLH